MNGVAVVRLSMLAAFVSLAILLAGLTVFAPRTSVDTHRFVEFGQSLVDAYHGVCATEDCDLHADPMYPGYIVSSLYLHSIVTTFPGSAPTATAVFNSLLFAVVTFLVFRVWQRLSPVTEFRPIVSLVVGLYVLFGLPDVAMWSYWMLSESLFLLAVVSVVYSVTRALMSGSATAWVTAAMLATCGFFVRPTGVVLLPLVFAAFLLSGYGRSGVSHAPRWFMILALAGIFVAFVVGPLVVHLVLSGSDAFAALPAYFHRLLKQAAWFFREGWIIADQPDSYVATPETILDIVGMSLRRFAYYYLPVKTSFSSFHNIVNAVYLIVAVGGGGWGFRILCHRSRQTASVALWLVLFALCYGLLHSLTIVSYEWRYQVPAMVPLWILAGVGLMTIFGRRAKSISMDVPNAPPVDRERDGSTTRDSV